MGIFVRAKLLLMILPNHTNAPFAAKHISMKKFFRIIYKRSIILFLLLLPSSSNAPFAAKHISTMLFFKNTCKRNTHLLIRLYFPLLLFLLTMMKLKKQFHLFFQLVDSKKNINVQVE